MRLFKRKPEPAPAPSNVAVQTISHADRFPFDTGYDESPFRYVDTEFGVDTATWWTLHLRTDEALVTQLADHITERWQNLVRGMLGGDSFHEWCEPLRPGVNDSKGAALHVLFRAPSVQIAVMRARLLCRDLGEPWVWASHTYLTTAADWAEGLDIFVGSP